jgi:hypothetical protein
MAKPCQPVGAWPSCPMGSENCTSTGKSPAASSKPPPSAFLPLGHGTSTSFSSSVGSPM